MLPPPLPDWLTREFSPSKYGLLRQLIGQVDNECINKIARCDYGYLELENTEALRQIVRSGEEPVPLNWPPREVLELTRWSQPTKTDLLSPQSLKAFHVRRAFACCLLLIAGPQLLRDEMVVSDESTSLQLLDSVKHLGQKFETLTAELLCWRLQQEILDSFVDEANTFLGVGLLHLAARLLPHVSDDKSEAALNWILSVEQYYFDCKDWPHTYGDWLLSRAGFLSRDYRPRWRSCLEELAQAWPPFALLL